MQLVCEALERTPTLRALVLNVEMSAPVLLDRQLARLAGIDLTTIRHRRLGAEHADRDERGLHALERLGGRLAFVNPPFDLANVAASADAFDAGLIVLDYIQRIGPPGEHGDRRGAVDATTGYLRQFADAGVAIVVVAALARSKDKAGRSSDGERLSLASFRETSELEYGADDAFILTPADDGEGQDGPTWCVALRHLKARHAETRDIPLTFDRPHQRFTPAEPVESSERADGGKLQSALRAMWDETRSAHVDRGFLVSQANGKGTSAWRTTKRRSALRFEILNAFVDEGMSQLTKTPRRMPRHFSGSGGSRVSHDVENDRHPVQPILVLVSFVSGATVSKALPALCHVGLYPVGPTRTSGPENNRRRDTSRDGSDDGRAERLWHRSLS